MFEWLYNAFVSFVTFVLSLFGMSLDKKVHFEEGAKDEDNDDSPNVAKNVVQILNGPESNSENAPAHAPAQ